MVTNTSDTSARLFRPLTRMEVNFLVEYLQTFLPRVSRLDILWAVMQEHDALGRDQQANLILERVAQRFGVDPAKVVPRATSAMRATAFH